MSPENWNYCPSKSNPADICSRGIEASGLVANHLWWEGPTFLGCDKETWPTLAKRVMEEREYDSSLELKPSIRSTKKRKNVTVMTNITCKGKSTKTDLKCLMALEDYSNLKRLLRVSAYIFRFVANLKRSLRKEPLVLDDLQQTEIDQAEECWLKEEQGLLLKDKTFGQVRQSLQLFLDGSGIIRCGGRLKNAPISKDTRYPILLPRHSHFTYLVVKDCHERVMHNGIGDTLTELRARFWVTRGRQTVRKVVSKCSVCKKIQGLSYKAPQPPPLPEYRVSDEFAFTQVGVDFAGPLHVRDIYAKNTTLNKAYITLFTCTSSRAVHLELVSNLTAVCFLNALIRFKARRGTPALIVSDNGKTFKDARIQSYCQRRGIKWKFNVEAAPWWGGFFERMVKSVKLCFKKCLRNARLNFEEMLTVLTDVEAVLNSRPLSFVFDEMEEPLTPSHLVVGRRILTAQSRTNDVVVDDNLSKRAKFLERILNHFWNRWRTEYLTQLREQHSRVKKSNSLRVAQVGDIVSIHDHKVPRQMWRMGKIERLLTGRDGHVRSALVRVKAGNSVTSQWKRPLQRLYPLEVQHQVDSSAKE